MADITTKQVIEHLKTLTALQLKELVTVVEKEFGVTAAVAAAPVAAVSEEVKDTTVSVILKEVGGGKIAVIKAVQAITGKPLMDSKKIVDSVATGPQVIADNLDENKAKEFQEALKAAGATVEVK